MITQNVFKSVFDNSLKGFTKSKKSGSADYHRFDKIKEFLLSKDFNGFTSEDLFYYAVHQKKDRVRYSHAIKHG